jgi:3-oxoacyl-[acyl-carrier protein] reductase
MDTDRLRGRARIKAQQSGTSPEEEVAATVAEIPAGRLGTAEEFGQLCAFLASQHAGYITGRNFLVDGGLFPGAF